jgi:hypothetical protein
VALARHVLFISSSPIFLEVKIMRRIDLVAAKYRARGHRVRVLSATRIEVIQQPEGNAYRVTASGRAIVGRELAAEIAAESEEPHPAVPGCARPLRSLADDMP